VAPPAPRERYARYAAKWARAALVVYVAVLAVGVLSPMPQHAPLEPDSQSGEIIGQLADAIRNVVLFLPIGAGIMAWRRSVLVAVGLGISLSLSLELAQQLVPGRYSSPVDLATNSLGAALGAGLYALRRLWSAPTRAAQLALAAWLAVAALLAGSALLLRPVLTDAVYFGGWTPELGHFERYAGRVFEAHVGSVPISSGGPVADSTGLREALRSGAPIVIRAIAGPPPAGIAPLVTLHDALQREILLVGVDGADLVLRWRTHSTRLGFELPSFRCRGAFAELAVDQPFSLRLYRAGDAVHVEVAGRAVCVLRWTPGRTWTLVVPEALRPASVAVALDIAWMALLALPAVCFAQCGRRLLAIVSGFAALFFALPLFGPIGHPPVHEWLGLALGVLLGCLVSYAKQQVASAGSATAARPGAT